MKPIHLYIKTHNKTGLKYFGKTVSKDPYKYKGSGVYWNKHLEKHGNDVSTEIIASFLDKNECKLFAKEFSIKNNIVESLEWANLKIEELDGGWTHINSLSKQIRKQKYNEWWNSLSQEEQQKINRKKGQPGERNYWYGKDRSGKLNPRYGVHNDFETYKKISESKKGKMVVKDYITGEIIGLVDLNHENIKNGVWVSINYGKKHSEEYKKKKSEEYKKRGIKPPSQKGKLWWTNGINAIRSKECPGEGYKRGRKIS
ncbi:MAG: hypothetical protein EBU90_18305 [Proteobacteria bacterium]|nr:hypothetical protein [Pseudomonadota bacterium]